MGYWQTGGHRGDLLELMLEHVNTSYKMKGIALVDKIPTPVKVVRLEGGRIVSGYFEKQSTVDYHGIFQGYGICYDAKETNEKSFPLKNIHEHQIEYMKEYSKHGGYSFIICHFKKSDNYYFLPIELIVTYWENKDNGGRKSISEKNIPEEYKIPLKNQLPDYIKNLTTYINKKERL